MPRVNRPRKKNKNANSIVLEMAPTEILFFKFLFFQGMVHEDERKMDALTKRSTELIMVNNNAKLLTEMLDHYDQQSCGSEEKQLLYELFQSCEKMQPKLFRYDFLRRNFMLNHTINFYDWNIYRTRAVINRARLITALVL